MVSVQAGACRPSIVMFEVPIVSRPAMTEYCLPRYLSLADCVLVSPDLKEIPACAAVLAKDSPVFLELLSFGLSEKNIAGQKKLPMAEDTELLLLVRNFLHDDKFDFDVEKRGFDLARLAQGFSIEPLLRRVDSKMCSSTSYLVKLLDQTNIHGTLQQAASLELSGLLHMAMDRMMENTAWFQMYSIHELSQLPSQCFAELAQKRVMAVTAELEECKKRIAELEGSADQSSAAAQAEVAEVTTSQPFQCSSSVEVEPLLLEKEENEDMGFSLLGRGLFD